ncbi:hypothetical protein [Burkholderia ubonensis]|uniref:hypothetical protein n=1 Tax=Burkholderia ubonensis TaxID=101571 RepID=UPI00075ECE77|nr:hypothetical protein [Burkholderia ubonensis]KUZ76880.1 hypothetical protein WI37_15985 [Burkholderia ubonensis]
MTTQSQVDVSITHTMVRCGRAIALGLLGLAAVIAFAFALPVVIHWISTAWYGWARILTRDYTTLVPAAWVDWSALIIAGWAACVAVKLDARKPAASSAFAVAAIAALLFGVIPANCAIAAMTMEWTAPVASGHTHLELAAYVTAFLVTLVGAVSPVFAIAFALTGSD